LLFIFSVSLCVSSPFSSLLGLCHGKTLFLPSFLTSFLPSVLPSVLPSFRPSLRPYVRPIFLSSFRPPSLSLPTGCVGQKGRI
jgi:hypothetical protein